MNKPMNMPIAPSAKIKHKRAFRLCKSFNENDKVRLLSTHNPWRPNAHGNNLFEYVLRVKPETTIGQILDDAEAIGYYRTDVMKFIRWLYTWGDFLEINGQRYFPEVEHQQKIA